MRYSPAFPGKWASTIKWEWGCRQQLFSVLSLAVSLELLEISPTLLCSDIESLMIGFTLIQKYRMTQNGYFTLNSVFTSIGLELFSVAFESNRLKAKYRQTHIIKRQACSLGTLVSGNVRFMQIRRYCVKFAEHKIRQITTQYELCLKNVDHLTRFPVFFSLHLYTCK